MADVVTTALEVLAVLLVSLGAGVALAAAIGGALGVGIGMVLAGVIVGAASVFAAWAESRGRE